MNLRFGFSDIGGGGNGGSGFNSSNSYSSPVPINLIAGDTTIVTPMTSKPKFISVVDSTNTEITSSLVLQAVLSGSTYNIVITSGAPISNVIINAYGA